MCRAVFTLMVGLMLSLGGSIGSAWAKQKDSKSDYLLFSKTDSLPALNTERLPIQLTNGRLGVWSDAAQLRFNRDLTKFVYVTPVTNFFTEEMWTLTKLAKLKATFKYALHLSNSGCDTLTKTTVKNLKYIENKEVELAAYAGGYAFLFHSLQKFPEKLPQKLNLIIQLNDGYFCEGDFSTEPLALTRKQSANQLKEQNSAGLKPDLLENKKAEGALPKPTLILDLSPQGHYYSALEKALAQKFHVAEDVFGEFIKNYPKNRKRPNALFWRGQMEFMNRKFDYAAMTLSEFNMEFPDNEKIPESTALIGEAVCHFAPKDQATAIYRELPNLLDYPTRKDLKRRLKALEGGAPCLMPDAHSASLIEKIKAELGTAPSSVKEILNAQSQKSAPSTSTPSNTNTSRTSVASTFEVKPSSTAVSVQNNDAGPPNISIVSNTVDGPQAKLKGRVLDEAGIAEVIIDGSAVSLGGDGSFTASFYVPRGGKTVEIIAFDNAGNKATKSLVLERGQVQQSTGPTFASLNPSGKRVNPNEDALALIIGVADYERTPAKAAYADKDAQTFYDYAMLKLGIPATNIKELINTDANEAEVRLAVKDWIARSTKQGQSDVYVFFAGHGLANQSGDDMYLLPVDGEPRLLSDTAIERERLFADISAANPRSVAVFLDTCYSGTTRGPDMLIASRPIAIRAKEQAVPKGFTVMTAAAGDQTAKPLEEAKHGMFSYFLMKGMEGDADANQDNQITAGELHAYVQQNVIQQSSGSQTPELQGDADRVLVRFQ